MYFVDYFFKFKGNYRGGYKNGTSMATPRVTGIAALLLIKQGQDPLQMKLKIMASSQPLDSLDGLIVTGGMVNADAALNMPDMEPDDDIPGVELQETNTSTVDQDNDLDDVYSIYLEEGEAVKFTLTGASDTDFDLYLYAPWAETVKTAEGLLMSSESEDSQEEITYIVESSGTYYVDVHAYAGTGEYTLAYEKLIRTYDDRDTALYYNGNWQEINATLHENGTAKSLNSAGSIELQFTGSKVKWTGFKNSTQGIALVYIDGNRAGEIDLYSVSP